MDGVAEVAANEQSRSATAAAAAARSRAPVFVIGSPRSGNNFLYHTLLSSGGFAVYLAASQVFNMLIPRFGSFSVLENREQMIKEWLASPYFERTGLDAQWVEEQVLTGCKSGGDFLRIIMGEICRRQNAERWANVSVEELLYLPEIKRSIPDALFVHIIRDGRDVALSLAKKGYVRPLPWNRDRGLLVAACYWDWIVRKARKLGRAMGSDYLEIRYEDLVAHPRQMLATIGKFISHDLDYDRICEAAVGTVGEPNSSFKAGASAEFNPVGRWRAGCSKEQLAAMEAIEGSLLHELGYLSESPRRGQGYQNFKLIYHAYFEARFWAKSKTPLSKFMVSTDTMHNQEAFTL